MGLYQSYQQIFVTNSPALLAEGKTVDSLAVGQIGLLDAKTYKAVTAPTYAKNKALYAVWGTPDNFVGDFSGVPNENEYSELIKGKLIRKFRASKAQRGQTPLYSLGWSGDVSDTDTLFAKAGESKQIWVKLTGTIIDRMYTKQGLIKTFTIDPACVDACTDSCGNVKCPDLAMQLAKQISEDKDLKKFIRVKSIVSCTGVTAPTETTCYKFKVTLCDDGSDRALGIVQAQYPTETVTRIDRVNAMSTYGVTKNANTAPADVSQSGVFIADCASCPTGYTLTAEAKVFQVRTLASVTSGNVATAFTGEVTITLVNTDPQFKTYMVTFPTTANTDTVLAAAVTAGYVATFVGVQTAICTQTTATTTAWASNGTLKKQAKTFRITLADSVCGSNRLTELQAAYPALTVSVVDSSGSCVHTYETAMDTDCYEVGCAISAIKFNSPTPFEGMSWVEVPVAALDEDAVCHCGLLFETAFFNMKTNECTFDAFPYENDIVHIEVSNLNPDFNADPCEGEWKFKQLRQVKFPKGHGAYIQHLEKESKMYDQRFRSSDPVVREVQAYSLQADPTKYYDQYVLEFEFKWKTSGGWAEEYSHTKHLNFFVPEGTGDALEAALNSYVTSAGIEESAAAV